MLIGMARGLGAMFYHPMPSVPGQEVRMLVNVDPLSTESFRGAGDAVTASEYWVCGCVTGCVSRYRNRRDRIMVGTIRIRVAPTTVSNTEINPVSSNVSVTR
jgi:hypothetical protein